MGAAGLDDLLVVAVVELWVIASGSIEALRDPPGPHVLHQLDQLGQRSDQRIAQRAIRRGAERPPLRSKRIEQQVFLVWPAAVDGVLTGAARLAIAPTLIVDGPCPSAIRSSAAVRIACSEDSLRGRPRGGRRLLGTLRIAGVLPALFVFERAGSSPRSVPARLRRRSLPRRCSHRSRRHEAAWQPAQRDADREDPDERRPRGRIVHRVDE